MTAPKATVVVAVHDDTLLGRRAYANASGAPRGCVVIGTQLAVFGSPVALRRLAGAMHDAAASAEKRCARGQLASDPGGLVA